MRGVMAVMILSGFATSRFAGQGPGIPAVDSAYHLAWSDEFNGSALDTTRWTYRTDSKQLSSQDPSNVTVQGGMLVINLRKQSLNGLEYTGGGVISKATFKYGLYEARLKIAAGSGWHSSFWMQRYNGADTKGEQATLELDAVENTSGHLSSYSVNVHRWAGTHLSKGHKAVSTPDLSQEFHVFGCEYTKDTIRFFFDGQLVQTVDWAGEPQGDVNIWLTSIAEAMGTNHDVDDSKLPGAMYVDWVRFYEK